MSILGVPTYFLFLSPALSAFFLFFLGNGSIYGWWTLFIELRNQDWHENFPCEINGFPLPLPNQKGNVLFVAITSMSVSKSSAPTSIAELDLSPISGKSYFQCERSWCEEFIYFLLVDRFHDSKSRKSHTGHQRSKGFATEETFYGGTLRGVKDHLDYIAGLGCTTIWLSPIFECNGDAYHGYDINNYLGIAPQFGTKDELIELVEAAHSYKLDGKPFPIRIVLDVVINHSGDNWAYPDDAAYEYNDDQQFDFGFWRREDRPIPTELRNPDFYHRKGQLKEEDWDNDPAKQNGDLFGLKDFNNDDTETGHQLLDILAKAHSYWIREADVDGFRIDAVKHMGAKACATFCSQVRQYAKTLGKNDFFIFGELAIPDDDVIDCYMGPQTTSRKHRGVVYGLDSVLDFRLSQNIDGQNPLRQILRGEISPQFLLERLQAQDEHSENRGEIGCHLITFLDNHDDFWQEGSARLGANASDAQIVGSVSYLLCALGIPCLYYGTEQGLSGGGSDLDLREAMFNHAHNGQNLLNTGSDIYRGISKIAHLVRDIPELHHGEMFFRAISENGVDFGIPEAPPYTLAFSRVLKQSEVLVAYNVTDEDRNDAILIDGDLHADGDVLCELVSGTPIKVETSPKGTRFVRLALKPQQFAILKAAHKN